MTDAAHKKPSRMDSAIEWLIEIRSPDVSSERIAAWQQWLASSPAHQESFDRTLVTWHLASEARKVNWPTDAECAEDCYDGSTRIGAGQMQASVGVAHADPLTVWETHYEQFLQPSAAKRAGRSRGWHRPSFLHAAPLLGVAASLMFAMLYFSLRVHIESEAGATQVIETHDGRDRTVTLADGSVVTVGPESLVWVTLGDSMRRVLLERGEAFFNVAKDSRRPFQVRAGDTAATAIGTAFDVRREDGRVVVAVAQGIVRVESVSPAGPAPTTRTVETSLHAGQKLTVVRSRAASEVGAPTPTSIGTEKRGGRLEYVGESFGAVAADLSRYTALKIQIDDPLVASLRFTGTINRGEIEDWLKSVEATFPVHVERSSEGVVKLLATTDKTRTAPSVGTADIIK